MSNELHQSPNDATSSNTIANIKVEAEKKKDKGIAIPLDEKISTDMVNKPTAAEDARRAANDAVRNEIAKLTFYFFFPFVAGFIVLMLGVHWFFPSDAKNISDQMTGIVKDMILPVVTLVLGYFFGSSPER